MTEVPPFVVLRRIDVFVVMRVADDLDGRRDCMHDIAVGLHGALSALAHRDLLRKDVGFVLLLHKNPVIQPILQTLLPLLVVNRVPGQYFLNVREGKIHVIGTGIEDGGKIRIHAFLNNVDDFLNDAAFAQLAMVFLVD